MSESRKVLRAAGILGSATRLFAVVLLASLPGSAHSQPGNARQPEQQRADLGVDSNIAFPVDWLEQLLAFEEWSVSAVRGSRFEGDVARRATLHASSGETLEIKLRPAARRDEFNNVPRYELAAYHAQRLFLEPQDYVVPPTAFRGVPLQTVRAWGDTELRPTYAESDQVFFVVQYWLQNVWNPPDPLDFERFEQDPDFARHMADLNVLTYLIDHKDANRGNVLVATDASESARAFTVDNGVAFSSEHSEQGSFWRRIRVPALSARTVERLRALELDDLRAELLVISEHRLDEEGVYRPALPSASGRRVGGLRRSDGVLQLGLTEREVRAVMRRLEQLLEDVDDGELGIF